ncbi:hypothetical protein N8T08_005634 [Aspergillus melleus]|uniref:Uncharacterized protein n=1 Tax=Aspergillus melleus TaxID=138277 RepID=A0ACC3B215_9EURO|nr:hypothetical protein N8T08_005634 [Aspergillus melleus]
MSNTTHPTIVPMNGSSWGPEAIGTLTFGLVATLLSMVSLVMACIKYAWCPWQISNSSEALVDEEIGLPHAGDTSPGNQSQVDITDLRPGSGQSFVP